MRPMVRCRSGRIEEVGEGSQVRSCALALDKGLLIWLAAQREIRTMLRSDCIIGGVYLFSGPVPMRLLYEYEN